MEGLRRFKLMPNEGGGAIGISQSALQPQACRCVVDYLEMPVIAFANLKGGVAKTTNAVAVAETLACRGYRVLVVDADHQCTASELLLGEARMLKADIQGLTLHDLLRELLKPEFDGQFGRYVVSGEAGVTDARPRLSVLPCSVRIDEFQSNVARARRGMLTGGEFSALWRRRRVAMGRWLRANYDFTVIDCPPSLTRHVQFLLRLSTGIVIPSVPDHLSLRGALSFVERLETKGIDTDVFGTLWTLYRSQVEKHRTVVSLAARGVSKPGKVPRPFKTVVPNASAIAAGAEPGARPVSLRQKYTSEFATLYAGLCDEIVARCGADAPVVARHSAPQQSLWGFGA
jgi:chromosome partitioning protein